MLKDGTDLIIKFTTRNAIHICHGTHLVIQQIIAFSFIFQARLKHEKEIWPAFNDQLC